MLSEEEQEAYNTRRKMLERLFQDFGRDVQDKVINAHLDIDWDKIACNMPCCWLTYEPSKERLIYLLVEYSDKDSDKDGVWTVSVAHTSKSADFAAWEGKNYPARCFGDRERVLNRTIELLQSDHTPEFFW